MKAQAAVIKINGISKLSVILVPETEEEKTFLTNALDECEDFDLAMPKPENGPSRSSGP